MVDIQDFPGLDDLHGEVTLLLVDGEAPSEAFLESFRQVSEEDMTDDYHVVMVVPESKFMDVHDALDPEDYPAIFVMRALGIQLRIEGFESCDEWLYDQ